MANHLQLCVYHQPKLVQWGSLAFGAVDAALGGATPDTRCNVAGRPASPGLLLGAILNSLYCGRCSQRPDVVFGWLSAEATGNPNYKFRSLGRL